jgi:ABC-type nitrate/sulfonate/bicarbonate transport system permease component
MKERRRGRAERFADEQRAIRLAIFGVLVLAIVLWEIATRTGLVDPVVASTPLDVMRAVPDVLTSSQGVQALQITGSEILAAFIFGTGSGFIAGITLGVSKVLREAYLPFITFLMSTPKVVLLPLFMLGFGITQTSAAAFGAFEAFFYVTASVVGGVGLVDERHLKVARAYRSGPWRALTSVILPSALPGIFAALWYGIKHALLGVLISELWASQGGVGSLIRIYADRLDSAHVIALIGIISVIAILGGTLWARVEARLSRWRNTQLGNSGLVAMA